MNDNLTLKGKQKNKVEYLYKQYGVEYAGKTAGQRFQRIHLSLSKKIVNVTWPVKNYSLSESTVFHIVPVY